MNNFAVFFDRDGIVNKRIINDYVKNIDEFEFIPDFFYIFTMVKQFGFQTFLITNQQGIGKKLMTEDDLNTIHQYMQDVLLIRTGYKFDKIYFSPSLAQENDYRRKPNPGMILEAIKDFNLNPNSCLMIGDSISDVLAGKNANISTILIHGQNHYKSISIDELQRLQSDYVFADFEELARHLPLILHDIRSNNQIIK
jgi:D-glycero-D-manno-heptose 1,7-bisphosphate phosphatase